MPYNAASARTQFKKGNRPRLKSLNGDRSNTDPLNWICIPRAMLPRLAGRWSLPYDRAPDELKLAVLTAARLEHASREIRKKRSLPR